MTTKSPQRMQQELLEEAEKLITELVAWQQEHPESDFAAMETFVLRLRQRFGQCVTEALLEIQEQRRPVAESTCPGCGEPAECKDTQPLTFESLLGTLTVRRGYYYCPACGQGYYPLDAQLHLPGKHWSKLARYRARQSFALARSIPTSVPWWWQGAAPAPLHPQGLTPPKGRGFLY